LFYSVLQRDQFFLKIIVFLSETEAFFSSPLPLASNLFTQIQWNLTGVTGGRTLLGLLLLLSPSHNLILNIIIIRSTSPHDYRMEQLASDLLVFSHVLRLLI